MCSSCKRTSSRRHSGESLSLLISLHLSLSPALSLDFSPPNPHLCPIQPLSVVCVSSYYEPIVKKHLDSILDVTAIVLANLCVAFIMTSQNEEAEELMRRIEREEEQVAYENADRQCIHLCIVNLVIGTLYCAKVRGLKVGVCASTLQLLMVECVLPCVCVWMCRATLSLVSRAS